MQRIYTRVKHAKTLHLKFAFFVNLISLQSADSIKSIKTIQCLFSPLTNLVFAPPPLKINSFFVSLFLLTHLSFFSAFGFFALFLLMSLLCFVVRGGV